MGSGKPNKLVGMWHKEQDGEKNPVGDAKDDGDSHGDGSGGFSNYGGRLTFANFFWLRCGMHGE